MAQADFVFVHGGGQGAWVWQDLIAALRLQYGEDAGRYLALDIPGCGAKRGVDTTAMPFAAMIDELLAEIEAFANGPITLVGHSQAGTVLPGLIERRPALFSRVIYVSCIAPDTGSSVFSVFSEDSGIDVPVGVLAFLEGSMSFEVASRIMFCNDMPQAQANAFIANLGQDHWPPDAMAVGDWRYDHLGGCPSSYVLCLSDQAVSPAWQERSAKKLHASRLIRIDAGHQVMNTRPHALAEILRQEAQFFNI
jgi:pimeloyl-ACP methyl ester carboxylesterase